MIIVSGVWLPSSLNILPRKSRRSVDTAWSVLDIEHGSFDLDTLERFIPVLKGLGLEVLAKVLAAERAPIQQALDFGADAVVIPHVGDIEHAKRVCAFAKFPPLGDRSFAGGRTVNYGAPDDTWVAAQDKNTRCYPMIENAASLEDVEKIFALETVDGVFIGPSDLSLRRNRGSYKRSEGDFADLKRVADAARTAGKKWILPAWSVEEKRFAMANGVHQMTLTMEHGALALGIKDAWATTQGLVSKAA